MYNLVIFFYSLAVRLATFFNRKADLMIDGQKQTFDLLKQKIDPKKKYIWFHAASLGEFEQGRPLIEKIKKQRPRTKILLTFFSPSGYEVRKNYPQADVICYLPFDTHKNVQQFLELVPLEMAIFIKYEFWKNYLDALKQRNIPTYIISAFFTPRQMFFKWYGATYRNILSNYTELFVQDANSKELLVANGINRVIVSGDTRFDRVHEIFQQKKQLPLIEKMLHVSRHQKDIALVAGSTWGKDEDLIIPYFNQNPDMKLIIAPHEIGAERIQQIIDQLDRPYLRYSELTETNAGTADCVIIDCFGLLSSIYRYGEIAYIGGGFGHGIHNVLEAAVYAIPVLWGPKYYAFREAENLILDGGGESITGAEAFTNRMDALLLMPEWRKEMGKKAGQFIAKNLGATNTIYSKIFTV
ncbi:MAG: 3-deoxy-D-manno-octulosonic acid transferase [Candidatus Symbiothrix sp.]|jgi:3-deoxy-D-manno-octulosonic-acid transferase|nr:3-deoxy-D-manno-octulosonic acid transferase [Candidatus Symbiothrix sp.]